jgi:hypothetical protein
MDGSDSRWDTWYDVGLPATIERCDIFVIVVDQGWDSSTWMAIEAAAGFVLLADGPAARTFFWNPEAIAVDAAGMTPYLKHELPLALDGAIRGIVGKAL